MTSVDSRDYLPKPELVNSEVGSRLEESMSKSHFQLYLNNSNGFTVEGA